MIVIKSVPFYIASREWEQILRYKHNLKLAVDDTGIPVVIGHGKINGPLEIIPRKSRFDLYLDCGRDSPLLGARHFNLRAYNDPFTRRVEYYLTITTKIWKGSFKTKSLLERLIEQKLQDFIAG